MVKSVVYFVAFVYCVSACVVPPPLDGPIVVGPISVQYETIKERSLKAVMDSLGLSEAPIFLTVDKSERRMDVLVKDSVLKSYLVSLGRVPIGDKQFQGDRKTPEGLFGIRAKYPHKDWHKFVWIDYPNDESWKRFKRRKANGEIPSTSKIGGEIGIHGVPKGMDDWIVKGEDWTFGCIAMKNKDLDEIYPLIKPKTTQINIFD